MGVIDLPRLQSPDLIDAGGHDIDGFGVFNRRWKWSTNSERIYSYDFFVFTLSDHLDISLGIGYIVQENLFSVNQDAVAPLMERTQLKASKRINPSSIPYHYVLSLACIGKKSAIALAEEQHRQEEGNFTSEKVATAAAAVTGSTAA